MRKKLITTIACLALIVLGALGLVACNNKNPITPFTVLSSTTIDSVEFTTEADVTIKKFLESELAENGPTEGQPGYEEYKSAMKNMYVIEGTFSTFDGDQAAAYGDPTCEGDKYFVLTIGVPAKKSYKAEFLNAAELTGPDKLKLSADAKVIDTKSDPTNNQLVVKIPDSLDNAVLGVEIEGTFYGLYILG